MICGGIHTLRFGEAYRLDSQARAASTGVFRMTAQLPIQYSIETDEALEERLASKGLKVVELYSEW